MVKDILIECLNLLDNQELKDKIMNISTSSNLENEISDFCDMDKKTIRILVHQLKNVINSVTKSYLKNFTIERVKSDENAKIDLKSLSKPVLGIKNVSDVMNNYIVYKTYFDHLKVPFANMEYDVCYNFETTEFSSIFDEVFVPLGLSNYCLALGCVSAYFQIKLLYNEAEMFESKFKSELKAIKPNHGVRSFFVWRS